MPFKCIGDEELSNLREVIESGELWRGVRGNFVARFEEAMCSHLNRRYVYAVNSGTSANEAAVAGLGLEPGDEVICPATAPIFVSLPVFSAGCIPVFADVDPRTLIISPNGIESRISDRTRAIVVVHLFGQPAPMDEIMAVAHKHNLMVVEDCAQAYDCYYKGRKVGTIGDVACFSLQQSKHITSGEGGFIATDDPEIYKRAVLYSNAGMPWYLYNLEPPKSSPVAGIPTRGHFAFGHNHRMSELQGAVALAQLAKIERFNAMRKQLVAIIEEELDGCPGILLAHVYPGTQPNYWTYPVQLNPDETALTAARVHHLCLDEEGIGVGYYHEINYLEHVFQEVERKRMTPFGLPLPEHVHYQLGLCPNAEDAAKRTLLFSVHHSHDPEVLRKQVQALRRTLERHV
ncbi:MAG TPA: DegT/DnrJ/EryC1/StrS family aminotransferase [Armatimonadetes bacterium]|nr:DegT/DnrJ/EryC1/StrS family aminotransferase [Armatimonadota bacterium]